MSDFLAPEDRPLLQKLVEDARVRRLARRSATLGSYLLRLQAGPPPRLPGVSVRLRHSVTDAAAVAFKEHFAVRGHAAWLLFASLTFPHKAVDVKICYDGEWLYCVMLKYARLDGNLRCRKSYVSTRPSALLRPRGWSIRSAST